MGPPARAAEVVTPTTEGGNTMNRRTFVQRLGVVSSVMWAQWVAPPDLFASDPAAAPVPIAAETSAGTTLAELVALAESSSPVLRQAAAEVESMRGKAYQAGLYPNPVASTGATQMAGRESQYFASLSQEIVTKQKLRLDQAAACREVMQAEFRFVRSRFELLTAVRQGYFITLAAQRRREVLTKLVEIASRSQQAATRLQAAGEGTRGDTLLFEIEVEKAEVSLENAEAKWQAAERQLVAILGLRDLQLSRIQGELAESLEGIAAQVLHESFVPYNADVQFAEHEVERNRFLLQRAIVQPFPNVTVSGGYQYQVQPLHNMAMLQASVPLPFWNRNEGNIASANAQVGKAQATVEQVQNQIARQMADATGRYRIADQQAKRYVDRIIPKAREGVKLIQEGFTQGQFDFLRLLQTQRALVEANLGYIDALEMRWNAAAELAGLAQIEAFP
jgi:outer membrane protein, heavy metal efflux system